jgi:teichuronic acid exporter
MENLKEKTVKGISWNLIEQFGLQGIRFVLGVIMARLLTPADFGLIGMITVFFAIAQVFIDSGFALAYVQKKNVTDEDANTVFYTNLSISCLLYGIFWFTAPYIAKFYNQFELIKITRIMAFVLIVNSFNIIQMAKLTRAVDFKKKTKITLIATLISGVLGVFSAYLGMGVWSLVIQQLANRFLITSGLWITSSWRPRLQYSIKSFREMFSYGAWVLGSGIIRTFFDNIYILTIGKFFTVVQLGFYTKANQLQRLVSQNLAGAVSVVSFPVFAKMQQDKIQLRNAMSKFLKNTMILTIPILITLIVVANPFILILLTEKWAPMIPFFQLLCIVGILYPIHLVNVQALTAQGKIRQSFTIDMIKNGLRIMNIIVMYRWGIIFIIVGEVIVSALSLLINTYYIRKYVDYGILHQIFDIKEILIGGVIAGLTGVFVCNIINNHWIQLFIGGFIVLSVYLLFQYLLNRKFLFEVIELKNYFFKE